ncbi:unnamed protein product [Amoebophrya sp. A25]|nr:unnamed protein product [Amoebophrya sp. A25]|eukprot:GSA25T00007641001.1
MQDADECLRFLFPLEEDRRACSGNALEPDDHACGNDRHEPSRENRRARKGKADGFCESLPHQHGSRGPIGNENESSLASNYMPLQIFAAGRIFSSASRTRRIARFRGRAHRASSSSSFLTLNCEGFQDHGPLPHEAYYTQPPCHIDGIPDTAEQLVLVAQDVDNLEDADDGRGPLPKVHLLTSHVPVFQAGAVSSSVVVPEPPNDGAGASQRANVAMANQASMKFITGMWKNFINEMPGYDSEKRAMWRATVKDRDELRSRHTDQIVTIPWRPLHPDPVKAAATPAAQAAPQTQKAAAASALQNIERGIEDEFPHRIVFSAYALDRSFRDDILARGTGSRLTWPIFRNMIRDNVLERVDVEGIAMRTRPAEAATNVWDYRNKKPSMLSWKDAMSYHTPDVIEQ